MSGWPDKPGVPLNPERDGWHWVTYRGEETPRARFWAADGLGWGFGLPADEPQLCRYEGPILTPAEVAAREAAAFKRGQEAMRERAAVEARMRWDEPGSEADADYIPYAIRALPVEEMPT